MSQAGKPPEQKPPQFNFGLKFAEVGAQIGFLTLGIVLLSVFGGIWLDRVLGTKPIIMLILVLSSAPLSLFLTYIIAMRAVRDVPTKPAQNPQSTPSKEDDSDN